MKKFKKYIELLTLEKADYCVYLRILNKEKKLLKYQIGVYTTYDLSSLNCYFSESYRLKYVRNYQNGLLFAHVGDPCTLIEMGKGSLLVFCKEPAGEIGEIGVRDSKNILPYYYEKDRYTITCEVIRTIDGGGEFGAIVKVDVYDNPLYVLGQKNVII